MRIIFIAELGHYKAWGPKNYRDLLDFLVKNSDHKISIYYSNAESPTLEADMLRNKPEMVIFFDTDTFGQYLEKFSFVFNWKIPTAIALLDMFYPSRIVNNVYIKKIDCLIHFGKSRAMMDYYGKVFPKKLITFFKSRFINSKRFRNYGFEKKYDIVFYGTRRNYYNFRNENLPTINEYIKRWENHYKKKMPEEINFYPLRERLENLLIKQKKYKILCLPEKNSYESNVKNEELSHLLNSSRMAVACSTIADICMHKYFEIAGSHCMILGDCPSDFQKIFKGKICEVNEFMSDKEILEKIDSFLNNKQMLEQMTEQIYNDLHKEHCYREAVKNLSKIVEEIKNYKRI